MTHNIKITTSTISKIKELDFNKIPFGSVFTDHMFTADYIDGEWTNLEIKPFANLDLHPATLALHYGQSIFEGMKATKHTNGSVMLFRPDEHAKRFNRSATRMCMPNIPEEMFLDAVHALVGIEQQWVPPQKGSALYIRPFMYASDGILGVRPSDSYKVVMFVLPVGPYYSKPVSLIAAQHYVRAVKGGVGEAKACGNYAAAMLPSKMAKEMGYDQVLWLDSAEFKYIQEVGTMNIFFVIDGKVITPATDGSILKGITRKSIIQILKEEGYTIEERKLSIDEVVEAYKNGTLTEVFGAGTAALVAAVNKLNIKGTIIELDWSKASVGPFIKEYLNSIRNGSKMDTHGWIVPIKQPVEA